MTNNVVLIVQARMRSTRLPGKVLLPLAGRPMLERLLERLRRVTRADLLVVATSMEPADDAIVFECERNVVPVFRGSESDVLARYAGAAKAHAADVVVRITSDCPLLDPALVDRLIGEFETDEADYLSNMLPPTFPYGMAVEVLSASALRTAHANATESDEREHVTPYIYRRPARFRVRNIGNPVDLSHHRWTVDTPEDYELVRRIFETLHPVKPAFDQADILQLLSANPDWSRINQDVVQRQVSFHERGSSKT